MVKIFVVGSFVVGLTIGVSRMPVIGEGLIGDIFDMGPGGKGTNQAIAAARLGAHINLMACVGNDMFSTMAFDLYDKENISTRLIKKIDNVNTGVGFVTLLPSGDNCIVGHLGANMCLKTEDVELEEEIIADSDIVLCQLEAPLDVVDCAMRIGKKHGAMTILNPAPARYLPADLLRNVDLMTPNQTETKIILGLAPDDPTPIDKLAGSLLELGVKTVVVTMGKDGSMIITKERILKVPAPVISAVDSTGAGDAFNGALAVFLGEGVWLEEAVEWANLAGAYAAMHLGVINGLATRERLENFKYENSKKYSRVISGRDD